jgi:hypothetical protein
METKDKLILALLVLAILFSVFSMLMSFSIDSFKPIRDVIKPAPQGNPAGQVVLFVEGSSEVAG